MRLEDKSLERRDVIDNEQAELLEQAQIDEFGEQRFRTRAQGSPHTLDGYVESAHDAAPARTEVFAMMRNIFDGNEVAAHSQLDPLHQQAIDLLAAAVRGHHPRDRTFVFAEDRRMMLEQSLAALQPMLAMGSITTMDHHAEGLTDEFARLLGDVNGLRLELAKLEATQEAYEPVAVVSKAKGGDEEDDAAADDPDNDAAITDDDAAPHVDADQAAKAAKQASGTSKHNRNASGSPAPTQPVAAVGAATRKPANS